MIKILNYFLKTLKIVLYCVLIPWAAGCTTIIAGKKASASGTVLLGHNEDITGRMSTLYKVPRLDKEKNEYLNFSKFRKIDYGNTLWSCLWSEVPYEKFSDFFLNEWGVTVTSNRAPSRETDMEFLKNEGYLVDGGIDYMLRRVIAENAADAQQGVEIALLLIERFGYAADGRIYCISDFNEAWVLHLTGGKHYCAMKLGDDEVVVIPNEYIIGRLDTGTDNTKVSRGIREYAQKRSWYREDAKGHFMFNETFGLKEKTDYELDIRQWIGQKMLGSDLPHTAAIPYSIKPEKPVTVDKIKQILRNHYEGTEFDPVKNGSLNPHITKTRSICSHNTVESIIVELKRENPDEMKAIMWIAAGKPCSSIYVPFYTGIGRIPACFTMMENHEEALATHFNRDPIMVKSGSNIWWSFSTLSAKVDSDTTGISPLIHREINDIEEKISADLHMFEQKAISNRGRNFNLKKELEFFTESTAHKVRMAVSTWLSN